MNRKELATICVAVTVAVSSVVSAMVIVDKRIDGRALHPAALARTEFQGYLETQRDVNKQILARLQSIEEAIRKIK